MTVAHDRQGLLQIGWLLVRGHYHFALMLFALMSLRANVTQPKIFWKFTVLWQDDVIRSELYCICSVYGTFRSFSLSAQSSNFSIYPRAPWNKGLNGLSVESKIFLLLMKVLKAADFETVNIALFETSSLWFIADLEIYFLTALVTLILLVLPSRMLQLFKKWVLVQNK